MISACLQLWALNVDQSAGGNAKLIFREWHDRLNFAAPAVQSNADDPEILIHVPFDGSVKLKAICVIGKFATENQQSNQEWRCYLSACLKA